MEEKNSIGKIGKRYFDFSLLFILIFIIAFGLVMVYSTSSYSASLSYDGDSVYFLRKQIISAAVGAAAMIVAMSFPYKFYKKLSGIAVAVSFLSIALILTPLGYESHGARRWIKIAGFSLQPAEICKLATIIFVAALLAKMGPKVRKSWKGFWFPMAPVGLMCLLIWRVTDNMSSAFIIGIIGLLMIMLGEKKNPWPPVILITLGAVGVLTVLLVVSGKLPASLSFRLERVLAWLDPEAYADGKGLQVLQSLYGIGSGGVWGKGLGKSMQKLGFLPEAQNDMIFSIICEELGLVGGLSVMAMYVLLLWRIRDITVYSKDYFGNLLVSGVFIHIASQVVLNIAVVTNTIPNTGVSLPFISYGGSSIIFLMIEMGIVFNVGMNAKFVEEEPSEEESSEAD